ncbi:uncharacterized protein BHQ10_007527 [Talaromyces amestolkiae]|uniref:Uncharacterized protein n=1 Tax=Talaromyces amestolkiae TaxID=1196081 RepID=A0A364L6S3_TALAM|nr:uncharacterized protein BHQ10_007527 [Talaromyces amestolkiae]RAO71515.1 hypothetical protein BHQ10_007527 [Talaromyces amestolkiae]
MVRNEQIPVDQAFYYERFSQSDTESRASTVPLEETSSCVNGNTIVQPDFRENNPGMRVSSCSLREVTKHDYADQAYKEVMDAAAATVSPSESRRRKTGIGKRTRELTDLDFMLCKDEFSQEVRRHGQAWTDEIRKLREELEILQDRNHRLQEEITIANAEKDRLRAELILSNRERDCLREESAM